MSAQDSERETIQRELAVISLALSVLAINQSGSEAANADERKRYSAATQKGVDLLLKHVEGL